MGETHRGYLIMITTRLERLRADQPDHVDVTFHAVASKLIGQAPLVVERCLTEAEALADITRLIDRTEGNDHVR